MIFCLQVFHLDDLGVDLQRKPLQQPRAGQHVTDSALGDALVHHLGRDGVVQIDGDAAVDGQRHVGQHGADRRGQQHADLRSSSPEDLAAKDAAEDQRGGQEFAAGQLHARGIGDLGAEHAARHIRMNFRGRFISLARLLLHREDSQLLDGLADRAHLGGPLQGPAKWIVTG